MRARLTRGYFRGVQLAVPMGRSVKCGEAGMDLCFYACSPFRSRILKSVCRFKVRPLLSIVGFTRLNCCEYGYPRSFRRVFPWFVNLGTVVPMSQPGGGFRESKRTVWTARIRWNSLGREKKGWEKEGKGSQMSTSALPPDPPLIMHRSEDVRD